MLADYHLSRPLDREFYERLRLECGSSGEAVERTAIPDRAGLCVQAEAGEVLAIELSQEAQIVNLFAFNPSDPDERFWAHNTSSVEGAFLTRYSRLWGTMPRFRPMLTVLDETVVTMPSTGAVSGKHHFVIGGSGTAADWAAGGGPPDVPSTWERLAGALEASGVGAELLTTNACLFQKTAVDPRSQRLLMLESDAIAGDRVVFFAEMDVVVVLALSPYRGGGKLPAALDGTVARVDVLRFGRAAEPLPWPYPGVRYPDISLYLDDTGTRSDVPVPTALPRSAGQ